jgi:hypothetical protein
MAAAWSLPGNFPREVKPPWGHTPPKLKMSVALLGLLPVLTFAGARDCVAQLEASNSGSASSQSIPAPLTASGRWHMYLKETYLDPGAYASSLGEAVIVQTLNYPSAWGGGFEGYGRRAANQYGLLVIQNSIHDGGAAALGYEPRYFRCQCTGFVHRTGHALEMSFLTYDRRGHKRLDLPQLVGAYGSGMLSAYWSPRTFSPLVQGVQTGHLQFGFVAAMHMLQEFSPEIKRMWPIRKILNHDPEKHN